MSVDSFINEWEAISSVGNRTNGRVLNNVEARMARTGWDNTVKVQLGYSLAPKKGNGTAFVKSVTELAKKHNITLRVTAQNLIPWKQSAMNRNEITNWLKKFGFRPMFTWPDGTGVEMITK